jgi:hypothetical protein
MQMLALEQAKQSVGCGSDMACLAEIGGALGADYLITGSVLLVGDTYLDPFVRANRGLISCQSAPRFGTAARPF